MGGDVFTQKAAAIGAVPALAFEVLRCMVCKRNFYECPECWVLLYRVGPHNCPEKEWEKILSTCCAPVTGCIGMCANCIEKDGCSHNSLVPA